MLPLGNRGRGGGKRKKVPGVFFRHLLTRGQKRKGEKIPGRERGAYGLNLDF